MFEVFWVIRADQLPEEEIQVGANLKILSIRQSAGEEPAKSIQKIPGGFLHFCSVLLGPLIRTSQIMTRGVHRRHIGSSYGLAADSLNVVFGISIHKPEGLHKHGGAELLGDLWGKWELPRLDLLNGGSAHTSAI